VRGRWPRHSECNRGQRLDRLLHRKVVSRVTRKGRGALLPGLKTEVSG
jgi:hypothetical protein